MVLNWFLALLLCVQFFFVPAFASKFAVGDRVAVSGFSNVLGTVVDVNLPQARYLVQLDGIAEPMFGSERHFDSFSASLSKQVPKPGLETSHEAAVAGISAAAILEQESSRVEGVYFLRKNLKVRANCIQEHRVLLQFQGYTIPLMIDSDIKKIKILGDRFEDCLVLILNHKRRTGELSRLGTAHGTCALPAPRTGSYLLDLVDHLAAMFDLVSIDLSDQSEIKAEGPEELYAGLTRLRTFQKGLGWYESRGYKPVGVKYEKYRNQVELNLSYSISRVLSEIHLRSSDSLQWNQVLDLWEWALNLYFSQNKSGYLKDFFVWLWETDPKAYVKIEEFLASDTSLKYSQTDFYQFGMKLRKTFLTRETQVNQEQL